MFRSTLTKCVLLLALGFSNWSVAEPSLALKEVAPGLFVHQGIHAVPDASNRGEIANIGFVIGDTCVAVIDTGGTPAQGEALSRAISQKTDRPVCYVINTHAHPDHIYGNRAFKREGVQFVGHPKLARALATRAPFYGQQAEQTLGITLTPEDFVPPDLLVETELTLDLGKRMLHLTAHPTAHTDHDLSVLDENTHSLWLGDLLFMGHVPVIDGSLLGWLKVIDGLKTIPAERVIPGHGPVTAEWPLALVTEETYLRDLAKDIRAGLKSHLSIEEAMQSLGQQHRADWQLFDDFHKRNVATAYAELEWEDTPP